MNAAINESYFDYASTEPYIEFTSKQIASVLAQSFLGNPWPAGRTAKSLNEVNGFITILCNAGQTVDKLTFLQQYFVSIEQELKESEQSGNFRKIRIFRKTKPKNALDQKLKVFIYSCNMFWFL